MRQNVLNRFTKYFIINSLLVFIAVSGIVAFGSTTAKKKHKTPALTRAETRQAEQLLKDQGYWTGPVDGVIDPVTRQALIAFQKFNGRDATGRLTAEDLEALQNAPMPEPKDPGYRHVEVDLDRQVLMLVDDDGKITKILPVSTGSDKHYSQHGMSGMAYTPRGRFKVYGKASGWKKSPLGMLYYPSYFSDGIAIHGNPDVPTSPESHGCVRIPMFASVTVSRMLPVGTIILIYDSRGFVSAKDWVDTPKAETVGSVH